MSSWKRKRKASPVVCPAWDLSASGLGWALTVFCQVLIARFPSRRIVARSPFRRIVARFLSPRIEGETRTDTIIQYKVDTIY